MGAFDDLIPKENAGNSSGVFSDLIPKTTPDRFNASMRAAGPQDEESGAKRVYRRVREAFTPLIGPTQEQVERVGIPDEEGNMRFRPAGGAVESEGFFPALSHPFVPIPKAKPEADDSTPKAIGKAVLNTATGFIEFLESPLGVATAGAGALSKNLGKVVAGGYALDMAAKTPEMATQAGEASVTGNTQEKAEAYLQLGVNAFLVPSLAKHAIGKARAPIVRPAERVPVSEFGGVTETKTENVFADLIPPVPETTPTLQAQLQIVSEGKTPAMLVTPGAQLHAEIPGHLKTVDVENVGRFIFDPKQTSVEEIQTAAAENRHGKLIGLSTETKPANGEAVLQTRDANGTPIKDEVVNGETLNGAVQAAQRIVPENGSIELLPAEEVLAQRGTSVIADQQQYPVVEVPLRELQLSRDVPNFKADADAETGVVEGQKLEGKYERLGTGAITVWERADGSKEVISGRHRFDLAKRAGEKSIPAQIVREADGFTKEMAMTLDAEMNIRDGQGSVSDYANYFRHSSVTPEEATARGLVSRAKGRAGWTIGKNLTDDTFAIYRAGKISEAQAVAIGNSAPLSVGHLSPDGRAVEDNRSTNEALQRVGVKAALNGKSAQEISNFIQAVKLETKNLPAEQFDLFAADDSALKEAERLASIASKIQTELSREIKATDAAAKNATTAKAKGLKFDRTPEEILAENNQLKAERDQWENWALDPAKVQQVRDYANMDRRQNALENWADETIKRRGGVQSIDPELLAAYTVKGAAHLARGLRDFGRWSAKMVEEYGERIRPHLRAIWERINSERVNESNEAAPSSQKSSPPGGHLAEAHNKYHHQPSAQGGRLFDITETQQAPADIYQHPEWYGDVDSTVGKESWSAIVKAKGNPDAEVTIYRAAPKGTQIEPGNWVTLSKTYAQTHASAAFRDGNVISKKVKAKDVRWAGDDLNEFGYFPESFKSSRGESAARLEQRLDSLKIDTHGTVQAFGLLPEAWNVLIDLVKAGVRGGRAVAEAIDWAIAQMKSKGHQFNEAGAKAKLLEQFADPRRQFGEKVLASEDISPEVTGRVSEYSYTPRSNETDLQTAQRIISDRGIDNAIATFKSPPASMPGAVQTALGKALILEMAKAEKMARTMQNNVLADELVNKQIDLIDHDLKRSTEIAQALQAMRLFGDMSPSAIVGHAKRVFEGAARAELERSQPVIDAFAGEMEKANAEAIDGTKHDPAVNRAARQVVDEQIAKSPEVHRGIVLELAEDFAQSEYILNHARAAVRAKVNELLNTQPRPPGLTISQHQRVIMNELAARAAAIANSHYQGAEPGVILRDKLMQRLGISQDHASRLARQLDLEFSKMVETAKSKLSQRIALQRARNEGKPLAADNPQTELDRIIARHLKELNVKLGEAVRHAATEVDAQQRTIGERIIQASGLKGDKAEALRAAFDKRFTELANEAKRRRIEQLEKNVGKPVRKVREQYEKVIEMTNLGAFEPGRLPKVLREKLGLPELTPEMEKEIVRRANDLQSKPEGFQKQRATQELMDYIARQRGLKWYDLPMAFWYANVLSGPTTHLVNTVSNAMNLGANLALQLSRQPLAAPQIISALARGVSKGGLEAAEVLKSGYVTGTRLTKFGESHGLELKKFEGWAKPLNAWKYVTRALAAEDLLFFKAAEEMKAATAARLIAKREGLSGAALRDRVDSVLGNLPDKITTAKAQAHTEGLTGLDFRRRVNEIIEQSRPEELQESAKDYALKVTFNNKPYGLLGVIAQAVNFANAKSPAQITRFVVPFTNIVANVTNESLNYLPPVGAARALYGHWFGKLDGKVITDREMLYDQWTKAALGTAMLSSLAIAVAQSLDDEDPQFTLYGAGPRTRDQRDQLKAAGWIPNSFKIGKRYYSFANTPAAMPLAIMGNYFDAIRYKQLDQTDALNRVAYAFQQSGHVILQSSFLDSLARLFEMANRDSTKKTGAELGDYFSRQAGSFVIPNALKQIDRYFDPSVYDANTVESGLVNQVPFARRVNRPALNIFGQTVTIPTAVRFTSAQKPDELLKVLNAKGAWISVPNREETIIGRKGMNGVEGEDYRILSPEEFYEYQKLSGQGIREQLEARLDQLREMTPAQAKALVQRVVEFERKKAKARF